MSTNYEFESGRKSKATCSTEVDVVKCLERRSIGSFSKFDKYSLKLKVQAEDAFVKKKFDELKCEMPGTPRSTFLMVFSPDGNKVASTHGNHNIYVTDVKSGKNIKILVGHPRTPWCIAFHPTSNQILASGCLGGQVRIWDLSGGSEVWTSEIPTVIASIAFHPDDRLLVIATYNELYFWDWSKREPFMHVATGNIKEKVRYVAFDKLGHKLITGISNTPQTRWERVRAPVPVPRQVDRSASPYQRRITPRLISNISAASTTTEPQNPTSSDTREPLTTVPERERRITACYRNLVREYELLVHRYLQLYRPPTMIDQGTDPMEIELSSICGHAASTSNGSNSQSQNVAENAEPAASEQRLDTFSTVEENNTEQGPSGSVQQLPRRVIFHLNLEVASPRNSSPSSNQNIVDHSDHVNIVHEQINPIDLSTYPASEFLSESNNNSTLENSSIRTNGEQATLRTSDIINNSESNSESDMLRSPSHQILSTRSLTNIMSGERTSLNTQFNINSQSKNKRRNSAPTSCNASITVHESLDYKRDVDLYSPGTVLKHSTDDVSKPYLRSEEPQDNQKEECCNTNTPAEKSVTQNTLLSNSSQTLKQLSNPNCGITRNQIFIASDGDRIEGVQSESLSSEKASENLTTPNTSTSVKETKNLSPISNSKSVSEVNSQITEHCSKSSHKNQDYSITNEMSISIKDTLNPNTGKSTSISEPVPSTSGISSRSSDFLDSSRTKSDSNILSKRDNKKNYDHPRKRLYPSLLKKNRRSLIDSSSDGSSSEEGAVASKRMCTTPPPFSSKRSTVNSGSTHNINNSEQTAGTSNGSRTSLNYNHELEALVTDLLMHNENKNNSTHSENISQTSENSQIPANVPHIACDIGSNLPQTTVTAQSSSNSTTTMSQICPRSTESSSARTTSIYTSPGTSRSRRPNRFFSHRASAFYPTRIQNMRPHSRLRHISSYLSPAMRNRLRILNTLQNTNRFPGVFARDEVINYSERTAADETPEPQLGFHPFDPPPEFATINPENIGIGNMYSNIVQELESSLNDVRNIRASNRLGETSDMLSSFSERLESIMNQSNSILRNLRTSIETLPSNDENLNNFASSSEQQSQPSAMVNQPRVSFNDNSFYLRQQTSSETTNASERNSNLQDRTFAGRNNSSVASDHTYPLNSRNSETVTNNMSPLMTSLHLTVSHIQRQARLLRQQVESIERIDRAMLEVAQLQMMRQMFVALQCFFRAAPYNDSRSSMSRVRQMMAGTRISDSSPYDSPNEDNTTENPSNSNAADMNPNDNTNVHQSTSARTQPRKVYPRCIFLTQRGLRRSCNILQRRCLPRERIMRRHPFRRSFTYRSPISRSPMDLTVGRNMENIGQLSSDALRLLTRRLESFLMEHGRHIGRVIEPTRTGSSATDKDEYIMMLRLNKCRARILGEDAHNTSIIRRQTSSVTTDGSLRYNARGILAMAIENLTELINATNISPSLRLIICNVVDLSELLSEILLLQIVDSIPPPSGMNLDPERESLSARIDQMCSRMLQNRLSGQSQQLTRCLRLTRLAVRHASRALNQTYTARRNSMLPASHNRDQRRVLLEEINNCLRNIRRHGIVTQISNERTDNNTENLSRTEWYRTIHNLIARYGCSTVSDEPQFNNVRNNIDNVAQTETLQPSTQGSSDDDNETYWHNNNNNNHSNHNNFVSMRYDPARPLLYRTNNVNLFNLLNNEEQNSSSSPRNRPWNIPTVQINDIPISQYQSSWLPRFLTHRQRLPERFSEVRTYPVGGVFRPRFLHPLHGGNPFEADFDESVREQIYDSDIMTPITPNHRIQVWEFSSGTIPNINNALKNVVVNECKIHNDASVDIANNGNILVTLLPSAGYFNGTNRLGVYSLKWESLGQCLYVTNFEQNAVSVSLSPLSRHLVVGLASRRVPVIPTEKWTMARIFILDDNQHTSNQLLPVREVEQTRDPNYMSVNCIRWLPVSGQGLVYATNTGQLRILT